MIEDKGYKSTPHIIWMNSTDENAQGREGSISGNTENLGAL